MFSLLPFFISTWGESTYVINKRDKPDLRDCFKKAAKYCFGSETGG